MISRVNPYKYIGPLDPVADQSVCIPRPKEMELIKNGIDKGDYWAVIGPRQIGKTTLLRQFQLKYPHYHYLYINFDSAPSDEEVFYRSLMEQFFTGSSSVRKELSSRKWKDNPELQFYDFLTQFQPKEETKKVVLLFDKIDTLPFLKSFLHLWRKIYNDRYRKNELNKYTVIITGSIDLIDQTIGETSPFNIARILYIKDFTEQQSRQLIGDPFRDLNLHIEAKAIDKLVSQISGHPQILQHACFNLVELAGREKREILEKDSDDTMLTLPETNSTITLLKNDLKTNKKLENLIIDIFKGISRTFYPYSEFSLSGAGSIVEAQTGHCAIRNKLYERYLRGLIGREFDIILIKEESPNRFFDKKAGNPLPYAVKQLQVKNYYGIRETGISDIPVDIQWIFLTGENAFGKTILLQAIAIGLFGARDGDRILAGDETKIGVEVHDGEKNLVNNLRDRDFETFTHFVAIGPSRLEIQNKQSQNEISEKSTATYSLFKTDGVLLNIEYELLIGSLKKDPKFEKVKQMLLKLLPNMAEIIVTEKNEVLYIEKESSNGETFAPLPFEKLAAGHRSIIAMIGDILIRLFRQNPGVNDPGELGGIVIIDELDVHLHPKWQRRLPGLLSDVFPKVQFIASTHSVIPFLGAPANSVFLKVTRDKDAGIQVQRLNIDIKNLLPNSILTSPIFDLDGKDIISANNRRLADIRTEDTYPEILDRDKIRERLRAFKASDMDFPDELFSIDEKSGKGEK